MNLMGMKLTDHPEWAAQVALFDAVARGDLDEVDKAMKAGASLDKAQWSALPLRPVRDILAHAVRCGNPETMSHLLALGASTGLPASALTPSLATLAIEQGKMEIAKALVEKGAPLNALMATWDVLAAKRRSSGRKIKLGEDSCDYPKEWAGRTWGQLHAKTLEWLIPMIEDVDFPIDGGHNRGGMTLLMAADDELTARRLLERGADPNIKDGRGWSALAYAIRSGSEGWARALVEAGADLGQVAPGLDAVRFANERADRPVAGDWALGAARGSIESACSPAPAAPAGSAQKRSRL